MRLHYLQHVPFENLGSILTWADEENCSVTGTHLYTDQNLPNTHDYDWLVVMGGPMNIYDEKNYPWLVQEKLFIRKAVDTGKVVIGICLGAQLIADALGGKVTENPHKEIGWFPVSFCSNVKSSPLFSFFPEETMVFHWHSDTFSNLPENAILLAENEACPHQAFLYEKRVFGFQFHLESTQETIEKLIKYCKNEMIPDDFVQTPEEIISHPEYIEQANQWISMFLTQLKIECEMWKE